MAIHLQCQNKETPVFGKNIVLGIGGGIAVYKVVSLLRQLVKLGANVKVVMTENSTKFVGQTTFETLSSNRVFLDLFEKNQSKGISHIELAEFADAVIIAPATANIIAKIAQGIADDILSTMMLAITCPVIICPSMNSNMYEHPATQKNLDQIKEYGYFVLSANEGELACGITGAGRLPEPIEIIDRLISYLTKNDMTSKHILVTAGPTIESIDPVRFISNPSSGKMGYAIARAAENRNAKVTLISGPVNIITPINVKLINVKSTSDMAEAVFRNIDNADIIIKVAAVSDYKPEKVSFHKIKKKKLSLSLKLDKTIDILEHIINLVRGDQVIVGFAAETCNLVENAKKKLIKKNLDMIVANLIGPCNSGFSSDTNKVSILFKNGDLENIDVTSKEKLAHIILDRVIGILDTKK